MDVFFSFCLPPVITASIVLRCFPRLPIMLIFFSFNLLIYYFFRSFVYYCFVFLVFGFGWFRYRRFGELIIGRQPPTESDVFLFLKFRSIWIRKGKSWTRDPVAEDLQTTRRLHHRPLIRRNCFRRARRRYCLLRRPSRPTLLVSVQQHPANIHWHMKKRVYLEKPKRRLSLSLRVPKMTATRWRRECASGAPLVVYDGCLIAKGREPASTRASRHDLAFNILQRPNWARWRRPTVTTTAPLQIMG